MRFGDFFLPVSVYSLWKFPFLVCGRDRRSLLFSWLFSCFQSQLFLSTIIMADFIIEQFNKDGELISGGTDMTGSKRHHSNYYIRNPAKKKKKHRISLLSGCAVRHLVGFQI